MCYYEAKQTINDIFYLQEGKKMKQKTITLKVSENTKKEMEEFFKDLKRDFSLFLSMKKYFEREHIE